MDLGLASSSAAGSPAKKQAVGGRSKDEAKQYAALLTLLAKSCLSSALQVRTLRAIVITCYRIPATSTWHTMHKAATVQWNANLEKRKLDGQSQESIKETLGPPHIHGVSALFKLTLSKMEKDSPEQHQVAIAAIAQWPSWKLISQHVRHCKFSKMFEKAKRLEVGCPLETMVDLTFVVKEAADVTTSGQMYQSDSESVSTMASGMPTTKAPAADRLVPKMKVVINESEEPFELSSLQGESTNTTLLTSDFCQSLSPHAKCLYKALIVAETAALQKQCQLRNISFGPREDMIYNILVSFSSESKYGKHV